MSFNAALLKQNLSQYRHAKVFWVAYSGGCDSHVLLHALVALRSELNAEIKAIHINHGLSPFASEWEEHCRRVCEQLGVTYVAISVDARSIKTVNQSSNRQNKTHSYKSSPEEAARQARYAEWKKLLQKNEVILLAHHQDDQAETVLIQLLRGSGVKGLAAMPAQQKFSQGLLCRPLLGFLREEIKAYAIAQGLKWIDDPSNFDTDFDRNFLRHDIVPLLETRWPSLKKTLSRTAAHSAEADQLLTELASQDWQTVRHNERIEIESLLSLDEKRQRNVLRYWLATICQLSLPNTVHLQRILDEVLTASDDANPEVIWAGGEVRRYQGFLYAQNNKIETDTRLIQMWADLNVPLSCNNNLIRLVAKASVGVGLSQKKLKDTEISLRFRTGGERCRPLGRGQTHQLKKLFQEWQVPPWRREAVPLIYVGEELAEVVGYCRCGAFAAAEDEASWDISIVL
jgi:tRNA(Ile)-lysidine synthase